MRFVTIVFSVVCHRRSQLQDVQIQADGGKERLWLGNVFTTNPASRLGYQYWCMAIRTNVSPMVRRIHGRISS
jgi:hypothetical protein